MVLIERRKFNSPDVPDLATQLKDASESHARTAAAEVFPALGELAWDEQVELGDKVEDEDTLHASHPHPHLNANKLVSATLGKAAAKWDGLRDRTVNNRHLEDHHPEGG
jgi:mannose/cellobiose epimerase-like protein (N-acyl-D-glucosamine 2-epimerase family)